MLHIVLNEFVHDTRVLKECRSLVSCGFSVIVICLHGEDLMENDSQDGIRINRIRIRLRNLPKFVKKLYVIQLLGFFEFFLRFILYCFRMKRIDIVHCHDLQALPLGLALKVMRKAPKCIYDMHELETERKTLKQKSIWQWLAKGLERRLISHSDALITVSESIADVLADWYEIGRPVVIRNVQKTAPYRFSTKLRELPQLSHIDRKICIAIYAGKISHGRGLEVLIEAARYLDRVIIVLMGAGNADYCNAVKKKIRENNLEDKVFLLPPVAPDLVHQYLCSANLGLMPTQNVCLSYYLGAGNKLFHYLMAGLPAVVSDHPEKRQIVRSYDVGLVCNERDPRDIAGAIQMLADDDELRRNLSDNALKSRKVLCWENEEKKLLQLYQNLENKGFVSAI